jgi:hypothetical protein
MFPVPREIAVWAPLKVPIPPLKATLCLPSLPGTLAKPNLRSQNSTQMKKDDSSWMIIQFLMGATNMLK